MNKDDLNNALDGGDAFNYGEYKVTLAMQDGKRAVIMKRIDGSPLTGDEMKSVLQRLMAEGFLQPNFMPKRKVFDELELPPQATVEEPEDEPEWDKPEPDEPLDDD